MSNPSTSGGEPYLDRCCIPHMMQATEKSHCMAGYQARLLYMHEQGRRDHHIRETASAWQSQNATSCRCRSGRSLPILRNLRGAHI